MVVGGAFYLVAHCLCYILLPGYRWQYRLNKLIQKNMLCPKCYTRLRSPDATRCHACAADIPSPRQRADEALAARARAR